MDKFGQPVCQSRKYFVVALVAMTMAGGANAFELGISNPDFTVRWDNTVRYNLGFRAQNCDKNICGDGAGAGDITRHQSGRKFPKRGDVVTNRVDILSEFDVVYRRKVGIRLSAAGWYDAAYRDGIKGDPLLNVVPGGVGQGAGAAGTSYTGFTQRWNEGPSGEILDAFAFARIDLGSVPVNLRLGQHNIYWGESLFSFVNGVAYGQGPVDLRKALATPGVEAKEVFKPLKQLSFSGDISDRLTIAGQYFFDWKPSPLPDGGTYWGILDGLSQGGNTSVLGVPFGGITGEPKDKRGDWGLAVRWRPEWLGGTLGFYYREYTDKLPQLVINRNMFIGPGLVPTQFGLDYSTPRQKMYAMSLSKQIGDVSVGVDLTYRKDAQLMALPLQTLAGQADLGAGPIGNSMLPTGDVITGVVNAIASFGRTALFESAVLQAELNFSHLRKVTANPGSFWGKGYNCPARAAGESFPWGCGTKNAYGMAIQFTPKWFQVLDSVDVEMPMFVAVGLHGNSVVPFGDNQGQGQYSIGLSADVRNQHSIALKYNGTISKHNNDNLGFGSNNNGLGKWWDRNWISLTYKTTF